MLVIYTQGAVHVEIVRHLQYLSELQQEFAECDN